MNADSVASASAAMRPSTSSNPPAALQQRSQLGARQASLLAQLAARPKSKEEYFAEWDAWANAGGTSDEKRAEAVERMKEWLENGQPDEPLNLSGLGLTSLPEHLPASLQELNVCENKLTSLPEHLPDLLHRLDVFDNLLRSLPKHLPDSLRHLDVDHNQLTSLPEHLPDSLEYLTADNNRLTSLPKHLPDSLRRLQVDHNRLTSLPEHLSDSLQILRASNNRLTSLPKHLPDSLEYLIANNNRLTSLPEHLPYSLLRLDVQGNQLTSLPEHLPDALQELDVEGNQLTSLPENLPDLLQILIASNNRLTSLPEHLPDLLQILIASNNRLTSLPERLPDSLQRLDVEGNQLTSLPENITRLDLECVVVLENNPLSERARNHLRRAMNVVGYCGPQIHFSMATTSGSASTRPLTEAVADWYGEDDREAVKERWSVLANEEGAATFSQFLDRLGGTVNYDNPQFRQSVVEWLSHLAREEQAELRNQTFQVSVGATASCEDRVSLTLNDMKKVRLANEVEKGAYDHRLPDLIALARGMFRLEKLEKIAREKVASLNFVDEIEVYLAYQVKLREKLNLPLDTPDMRFFDVSYVTPEDLAHAEQSVKELEKQEFIHYLSTDWQPWQSVLKRLYGEEYAQAQDDLIEAMGDEFSTRVQARLTETGLENDSDAQRTVGAQVLAEITREKKGALTKAFLESQNLSHLLEHPFQVVKISSLFSKPYKLLSIDF